MWPDRVSNPGPLTYESGALRGPALNETNLSAWYDFKSKAGKNQQVPSKYITNIRK